MLFILAAAAAAAVATFVARQADSPTHTATIRVTIEPGGRWGVRQWEDIWLERLGPHVEINSVISGLGDAKVSLDRIEPWDPFIDVIARAEVEVTAITAAQSVVEWMRAESLEINSRGELVRLAALEESLLAGQEELAAARLQLDADPQDGDAQFRLSSARSRLAALERQIADVRTNISLKTPSVTAVRLVEVNDDRSALQDAAIGALIGALLGTAVVLAYRP